MGRFHELVVRHAPVYFAAQRNSRPAAEPKSLRPLNDRLRPGLDSDLIKPGVARFRHRLHEIERAAIGLLPIVKNHVADLDRRDAIVFLIGTNGAALERGNSDRDLEGRSRRIRRPERAR